MISNEIIMEYQEKLAIKYGVTQTDISLDYLQLMPNVIPIVPYYHWNLITADPDDNKFVDCAFLGNAHYIVTHDKHFDIVKNIPFPKVEVIKISEFQEILFGYK